MLSLRWLSETQAEMLVYQFDLWIWISRKDKVRDVSYFRIFIFSIFIYNVLSISAVTTGKILNWCMALRPHLPMDMWGAQGIWFLVWLFLCSEWGEVFRTLGLTPWACPWRRVPDWDSSLSQEKPLSPQEGSRLLALQLVHCDFVPSSPRSSIVPLCTWQGEGDRLEQRCHNLPVPQKLPDGLLKT